MRRGLKPAAGTWALPLGLLLLGSLAFVLASDASLASSSRSSGESGAGLVAIPAAPAAVVAREGTPVAPGLALTSAPPRGFRPELALAQPPSREAVHRAVLIETRVAHKYRPFRESLSLP